jgi:hypothetical protein
MTKRNENTVTGSLPSKRHHMVLPPKMEVDFESLIAAGIAAVVIKPAKAESKIAMAQAECKTAMALACVCSR